MEVRAAGKETMRVCELKQKEVINIKNCKSLGCIMDVEFDISNGCITGLIIPGPGRLWGIFGRETDLVIGWCQIVKIGPDIVLVDVCEEEIMKKCNP